MARRRRYSDPCHGIMGPPRQETAEERESRLAELARQKEIRRQDRSPRWWEQHADPQPLVSDD